MRGAAARPLRFRRLRWAVPVAAVTLLALGASARASTVIVGSPLTQLFVPGVNNNAVTFVNTALPEPRALVTSPVTGAVVRWRVLLAEGGPFRLRVLRTAGGTTYAGVGTSSPETPASPGLQTFATVLPIQAGETIGLDSAGGSIIGAVFGVPGAQYIFWEPPLPDGQTLAATLAVPKGQLAFNADVQPRPSVSSISPTSGPSSGGRSVTIAGSDFAGVSAVDFGGDPAASYSVNAETQIVATSPAALPGPVDITVTTVAGRSATGSADVFTFTAPPAAAAAAAAARVVCVVPKLKGRRLRPAKRVLRKRHCRIGKVIHKRRKKAPRKARVIKQHPRPRAVRPAGAKVHVWLHVRKKAERKAVR